MTLSETQQRRNPTEFDLTNRGDVQTAIETNIYGRTRTPLFERVGMQKGELPMEQYVGYLIAHTDFENQLADTIFPLSGRKPETDYTPTQAIALISSPEMFMNELTRFIPRAYDRISKALDDSSDQNQNYSAQQLEAYKKAAKAIVFGQENGLLPIS